MNPDWKALNLSIQRSNAAYLIDPNEAAQAFKALGSTFLGQYRDTSHQAVLSHDGTGQVRLTISGTRFSEGPLPDRIGDLIRDIDWTPIEIEPGVLVAQGAWGGMDKVVQWATSIGVLDELAPWEIEGHSLGGWRSFYAAYLIGKKHVKNVYPWENPKPGNAAFHTLLESQGFDINSVVNDFDPWFAWPWEAGDKLIQRPGINLIWLDGQKWQPTSEWDWPGVDPLDIRFDDHEPKLIMPKVAALTTA